VQSLGNGVDHGGGKPRATKNF